MTHLAIGLENGTVLMVRGDLARAERTTKTRVAYEGESTVTGLTFAEHGLRIELVVVNRDKVVKLGVPTANESSKSKKDSVVGWFDCLKRADTHVS